MGFREGTELKRKLYPKSPQLQQEHDAERSRQHRTPNLTVDNVEGYESCDFIFNTMPILDIKASWSSLSATDGSNTKTSAQRDDQNFGIPPQATPNGILKEPLLSSSILQTSTCRSGAISYNMYCEGFRV